MHRYWNPLLHYGRLTLTSKFLTSILQYLRTTIFNHVSKPPHNLRCDHDLRTNLQGPLDRSLTFHTLKLIFSTVPPWLFSPLTVNFQSLNFLKPQRRPLATENFFKKSSIFPKNQPYVSPTAHKFITDLASPIQ